MHATLNLQWAFALVDGLTTQGVHRAVISPGSRSTPLVLACERHPAVQTWVQIDERCAGFFALGLARCDARPVILVATSGSAPSHWYPAVIEASEQGTPLILLSADRPPELQGWHANQTTDQTRLFGPHVRVYENPGLPLSGAGAPGFIRMLGARAARQAQWPRPGPVHVNQPFREPLVPDLPAIHDCEPPAQTRHDARPRLMPDPRQIERVSSLLSDRPGVIVCGPAAEATGLAPAVSELGERLRCPLLADPLSGLRFGDHLHGGVLSRYDAFLRNPRTRSNLRPAWVLRFGHPPVSKSLQAYLGDPPDGGTVLVAADGDWPDPMHNTGELIQASPVEVCRALCIQDPAPAPADWLEAFQAADRRAEEEGFCSGKQETPFEGDIIADLLAALPPRSLLFCGNSLPIRALDTWSGTGTKPLGILGNRGVSGIDGNVSTLLGLAAGTEDGPVVGLLGDLAFYHDMNGLLAAEDHEGVIIVLNNDGGGIFGYLDQAELPGFERYWLTPTGLDLSRVAGLYDLAFHRVEKQTSFAPAFVKALEEPGISLIEVMLDRQYSMDRQRAYWAGVSDGL